LPLLGQSVVGRLSVAEEAAPIQGALVLLLDEGEEVLGGGLTDEEGGFMISAPGPGRFLLRFERIGYQTRETPPFTLEAGQTREVIMVTLRTQAGLEGISIGGRGRCVVRPEEGLKVAQVWEEARKALANQEWASRSGYLRFQVVRYRRKLDLEGNLVAEHLRETATFTGRTPIRSLPPDELSTGGYVRELESGTYEYFGPDARVLLSRAFLDTHCFRLMEDEDRPGMVGLSFDPVRNRRVSDIRGTFWLHRKTATLALLEYSYTRAPWSEAQGVARGRVDFGILPSGAWVVQGWWIRMPLMVVDHAVRSLGGEGLRVEGVLEEGEEVVKATVLGRGRIAEVVATPSEARDTPRPSSEQDRWAYPLLPRKRAGKPALGSIRLAEGKRQNLTWKKR
jgi:hypothetical protein